MAGKEERTGRDLEFLDKYFKHSAFFHELSLND
jgi:hypothetical protein